MNHIKRFKELEDISNYNINENISPDVFYQIKCICSNSGDEFTPEVIDDDYNYNPYDIKEMVKLLIKKRQSYSKNNKPFLVKVTTTKVPQNIIKNIEMELKAEKYNI